MVTNSWRSAINHDLREEKCHFLKISNWYCVFELRSEIRGLKLLLTPSFSFIHPKIKKQWRFSTSLVAVTLKWRLWRHTFQLEMTSSIFSKFHKVSIHRVFLPSFSIIWLESENFGKFASLIMFLATYSPINWLPWQQWMTYSQAFNFKR